MPLKKQNPALHKVPSRPAEYVIQCPYCEAGRDAAESTSTFTRLLNLFRKETPPRSPPSPCRVCDQSGRLVHTLEHPPTGNSANLCAKQRPQQRLLCPAEPLDEYLHEGEWDDDSATDVNVGLHDGATVETRQPTGPPPGFVETWLSKVYDREACVKRWGRSRSRWARWSREHLVKRKPGRRSPPVFASSAPRGLAPIQEVPELEEEEHLLKKH